MQTKHTDTFFGGYIQKTIKNIKENDPLEIRAEFIEDSFNAFYVKELAEGIKTNTHLKKLRLTGCNLNLEDLKILRDAILSNHTLKKVSIAATLVDTEKEANLLIKEITEHVRQQKELDRNDIEKTETFLEK